MRGVDCGVRVSWKVNEVVEVRDMEMWRCEFRICFGDRNYKVCR